MMAVERKFHLRRDLQFSEYTVGLQSQLVVKDPVKLEYYLFESFERLVLKLLRHPKSVSELETEIESRSIRRITTRSQLEALLRRLLHDNLVVVDGTGTGASLWQSHTLRRSESNWQWLFGILAIRFRGFDPARLLDWLNPWTKFLFQPVFLALATVLFVVAVVAIALNARLIFESTLIWQNWNSPLTIVWIGLAVMTVKVLHELGHALACRSIDRKCHEMGVLLLAFIPCLYCNVSDVWMEPNRWKRMLVSVAGIYVEMLIAVLCVPLWLISHEGPLQVILFSMIMICSVNTILINGNPLLRYDGYYLLSDLLGMPNLYAESQKRIENRFFRFFFGCENKQRWTFQDFYGLVSRVYRILVIGVIVIAIYSFFNQLTLPNMGVVVAGTLGAITLAGATWFNYRRMKRLPWRRLKRVQSTILMCCLIAVAVAVLFMPVTTRVIAKGEVGIVGRGMIYAPEHGQLNWEIPAGETVAEHQLLGTVANAGLDLSIFEQKQLIRGLELELKNHEILKRNLGIENSTEIALSGSALDAAGKRLLKLEEQLAKLQIKASESGVLQMLPARDVEAANPVELGRTDSTLLPKNQGAYVESGEPVAVIVNPNRQVIWLQIPEQKVQFIEEGQRVKFIVWQHSPEYKMGIVEDISGEQESAVISDVVPAKSKPEHVLVQVSFESGSYVPSYRSRVDAVVLGESVPLYRSITRFISENFKTD